MNERNSLRKKRNRYVIIGIILAIVISIVGIIAIYQGGIWWSLICCICFIPYCLVWAKVGSIRTEIEKIEKKLFDANPVA